MARTAPVNAAAASTSQETSPPGPLLNRDYRTVPDHCLSICEPWAWACVVPFKPIENRNWATKYRGRIAVHASSSGRHMNLHTQEFLHRVSSKISDLLSHPRIVAGTHELFNYGAIIGTVQLRDCIDLDVEDINGEDEFRAFMTKRHGDWYDRHLALHGIRPELWADGKVLWIFDHAVQFTRPIEAKGALNLWQLSREQQLAIADELRYTESNPPVDGLIESRHVVANTR